MQLQLPCLPYHETCITRRVGIPSERAAVPDAPYVYIHVVRGEVRLGGTELRPGDSVRLTDEASLELEALRGWAEVLVWEFASAD